MEPARNDHYDDEEESQSRPQLRALEGGGEKSEPSGQLHSVPTGGVYDRDDSSPVTRPNLQALEGGGQTTAKGRGHLQSVGDAESSGEFGFRHEGDEKAKGVRGKLGKLNKKRKSLLLKVGGGALGVGVVLLLLAFLIGSLLIPNFVSSIVSYQFARVARETVTTQSKITTQKIAIDSAPDNAYQRLKNRFNEKFPKTKKLFETLGKASPKKAMQNLKATKLEDFQYGEPSRALNRQRLVAVFLEGERIEIPQGTYNTMDKLLHPIKYAKESVQVRLQVRSVLRTAYRDSNALVRSLKAKEIRAQIKARLVRWTAEDRKKYRNTSKTTQDVLNAQKSYETATNSGSAAGKAAQGTKNNDIKEGAEEAAKEQDACYKDAKCTEETVKKGGGLAQKARAAIEATAGEGVFSKVLNVISPAYAVAVPICLVYDGSTINSADTIDTNNEQLQRSFISVASAGDQQERGEAPAEGIGALSRQLGQTGRSIPQQRASGVPVDTSKSFSPQASAGGSYEHNILDALFPKFVAGHISPILDGACPVITDPVVATALAGLNIVPGVGAGLQAAGQVTTRVIARTIATSVGNVVRNMFTKKSLQQITTTTVATVGATLLARLIVMQHMGAVTDGTAQGTMYADQVDMGGNIHAQEIDRKQNMGAPLTNQSVAQLRSVDQEFTRSQFASQSFFNRYFSITNPGSFMNRLAVTTGTHLNLQSLSSTLSSLPHILNPANLLTKLGNIFHPFGKVSAASEVDKENYGNVQWGWTAAEENAFTNDPKYEMLVNQEALDASGKEEDIQEDYGKCFEKSIGQLLADGDIIRDGNGNIVYDEGDCSPENLGMKNPKYGDLVFRWRVALRYSLGLDELLNQQEVE